MRAFEQSFRIPKPPKGARNVLAHCAEHVRARVERGKIPTRFVIIGSAGDDYVCETGVLEGGPGDIDSVFDFVPGPPRETSQYTVVMVVPTGVGAEVGGHAGDAGPASRLVGSVCDRLIVHPNVVNASEINEMPENALYVEGSVLARLMMGTVALRPTRGNRILFVAEAHPDENVTNVGINMFNGARAACGYDGASVLVLDKPFSMSVVFSELSGRATGTLDHLDQLVGELEKIRDTYDAVAINSRITYGMADYRRYMQNDSEAVVNPIGGVEAMLTHVVSMCLKVPSAHSPQLFMPGWWGSVGLIQPALAVEPACIAFVQCIFKGLHRSPRIVTDRGQFGDADVICGTDVDCLITPDRCIGLPLLAALERGTRVIAVRDRYNVMKNDLTELPWRPGQLHFADGYLEAAGLVAAFRAGVAPETVRRPIGRSPLTKSGSNTTPHG